MVTKKCKNCGKSFTSKILNQVHCSEKCRSGYGYKKYVKKKDRKFDSELFDWGRFQEGIIV